MSRPSKLGLRTRLIVDRRLQFDLVTRMLLFVLFVFCLIGALLFSPLLRQLTGGKDPESLALVEVLLYMQSRFWPVALICLGVGVIGAVLTSHRIAGPLVRVKRIMAFVQECHFPKPLKTRPGDYFKIEVELLNEMVSGLSTQIHQLKAAKTELDDAMAAHAAFAGESLEREVRESFALVKEKSEAVQRLLDGFSEQAGDDPEGLLEPRADAEPVAIISPAAQV